MDRRGDKERIKAPGHDEETDNSHRSERVEAVGILDDRGFESGRLLTSGIAMGAHSRRDMDRSIPIYPKLIEATKGKFRRAANSLSGLSRAFRKLNDIVKPTGCVDDEFIQVA